MRTSITVLSIAAILGVSNPADAQQMSSSSDFQRGIGFIGGSPRNINNVPIDVGKASQAFNMSNMIKTPTQQRAISFSNLLPKFSMPSWPPKVGVPTLPQGKNPYQPNRPVGVNLFGPRN
jgi:hypothetical protein